MHDHIINIRYNHSPLFWRVREANASRGIQFGKTLQCHHGNTRDSNFSILKIEIRFMRDTTQLSLYLFRINFDYRYVYELLH